MADRIVVDTGPLIAVARAQAMHVLGALPFEFICPPQVRAELDAGTDAGHVRVEPDWLAVVPLVASLDAVAVAALDPGEAAVIQLALEQQVPVVCIDETKGRRMASAVGLQVTGTLGLLVRAKNLGLVPTVAPIVDRMQAEGAWFDADLVRRVLRGVGE